MRLKIYNNNIPSFVTTLLILLGHVLVVVVVVVDGAVPCQTTEECETIYRPGSECLQNRCTNPFTKGGCLSKLVPDWKKIRVCNSHDAPDAIEGGYCRGPNPGLEYEEIRILGQNWESASFQAWLLQILLSEVLDVPASIETGDADSVLNFYDPENRLGYAVSYDFDALRVANTVGDCRNVDHSKDDYQSCCHVIPEIWSGQKRNVEDVETEGVIEPRRNVGLLGHQGFFIPRFTAKRDPTLLTFFGLMGDENRRKMAETFKRPTTWKEYCDKVSPNQCTTPDSVVARAPQDETEENRMFEEGLYTGHFRATEDHDCDTNNATCGGDVVDYPCGWTSYTLQQFHHLNIALKSNGAQPISNGYTYNQMTEIWAAANATKSDVMMRWWTPEALYQTFLGTEAEFQRVSLPPPTQDCVEARVTPDERCDGSIESRTGDPKGTCDDPSHSLARLITTKLRESTFDPDIPAEIRSPGYEMVSALTLSELQIGKIFDYWLKRGSDKWNFDPRDAACRWLAENLDVVKPMIPKTYPRLIQENQQYFKEPLFYVALAFAFVAIGVVLAVMWAIHRHRTKPAVKHAQIEFLSMLLGGHLMVALASLVLVIPATDASCTSVVWLSDLGFTLGLVPLIVKMGAVNKLMNAAKSMRRVVVKREKLFGIVFGLCFVMCGYLAVWTALDPTRQSSEYEITDTETEIGETIVSMSYHCESESDMWRMLSAGWDAILLLIATILTIQTRRVRREINESRALAILIYSHCIFVAQRIILFSLEESLTTWSVNRYLSLIYSVDTITACCIYFVPKLLSQDNQNNSPSVESRRAMWSQTRQRSSQVEESAKTSIQEDPPDASTGENTGLDPISETEVRHLE